MSAPRVCLSRVLLCLFAAALALPVRAQGWDLSLVSRQPVGDSANATTVARRLSSTDGRFLLLDSDAGNLIAGITDRNSATDVFLYDRVTQVTSLVSRSLGSASTAANGRSLASAISADGRWVLYRSDATDILPGVADTNANSDVYLFDTQSATTTLVSRSSAASSSTANNGSFPTAMSADGQQVLFESTATDLVAGVTDGNNGSDVFLYDRLADVNVLVSRSVDSSGLTANAASVPTAISADGQWVLFFSFASNLISGATVNNGQADVLLYSRVTGVSILVSRALGSATTTANGQSLPTALSADGRWILFRSDATNIVSGASDSNAAPDAFLFDRFAGTSVLVSHSSGSTLIAASGQSFPTAISADGQWIVFYSNAANVAPGATDGNGGFDVFLFDRNSGAATLVSHAGGTPNMAANAASLPRTISSDGQWVLYQSDASDVVTGVNDGNGNLTDVFLFDRIGGTTTLVSRALGSATNTPDDVSYPVAISSDGGWVAFYSYASNVVSGVADSNGQPDTFLFERATATTRLVSRALQAGAATPNNASVPTALSADGSVLLFQSEASNVIGGVSDNNGSPDVFLLDRGTGVTRLVSHAQGSVSATAAGASTATTISADGRWVLFGSEANNLIASVADGNGASDVFLFEVATGVTTLVSRSLTAATSTANAAAVPAAISADGRWVLYSSAATDVVNGVSDDNLGTDVFLFDRTTGSTTLVSHSLLSASQTANNNSSATALSADGRWLLFRSGATDVVAGTIDGNGTFSDVFLFDRLSGSSALVSHAVGVADTANNQSMPVAISADGLWVVFRSDASNVVAGSGDSNNAADVFLYERTTGVVNLVSHAAGAPTDSGNAESYATAISDDGRFVLFQSYASNLISAGVDANLNFDVFLFDRNAATTQLVSHSAGAPGTAANDGSRPIAISNDGSKSLWLSVADDIVATVTDNNNNSDVFMFDRASGLSTLVSHRFGADLTSGNNASMAVAMNAAANVVALNSRATDLVDGVIDINSADDVFVAVSANLTAELFSDGFE